MGESSNTAQFRTFRPSALPDLYAELDIAQCEERVPRFIRIFRDSTGADPAMIERARDLLATALISAVEDRDSPEKSLFDITVLLECNADILPQNYLRGLEEKAAEVGNYAAAQIISDHMSSHPGIDPPEPQDW